MKSFGSWTDPTDDQTTWQAATSIDDDRWIVRLYNVDPTAENETWLKANNIASEELDEGTTPVVRWMKLFTAADTPTTTNAQNQRTHIADKLMDFDFSNGFATFNVSIAKAGRISFPSNHQYRIIGPTGEKVVSWDIFGKTLEVED